MQVPLALHEASGRSVKGKSPSPAARYSGGGICRTGGHLGARGSGHSEGHTKPPNAFPSTLTLLHPQSKWVGGSGDDDEERSMAICKPPMTEQRSSGNRTRQQLVLQARRWITRFFLKRALVCSRRLAPIALGVGEAEEMLHSGQVTGFELGG